MRSVAGLLFAAIVVCGIDFEFVWKLSDRGPATLQPYDAFLVDVHRRTPPGASVAIRVPADTSRYDSTYRYYRAVYRLPGRRVIPLDGQAQADFIAEWDGKRGVLHRSAH